MRCVLMGLVLCFALACSTSSRPGGDAAGSDAAGSDAFTSDIGPAPDAGPILPVCSIAGFDAPDFLTETCGTSTCHGSDHEPTPDNAVDLETRPIYPRLSMQTASHPACADDPIIDEDDWENSFMIRKLRAQHGMCGDRMPFDGVLTEPEILCIGRWLAQRGDE